MTENKNEWIKMKPAEMEKIVITLHKEGHSPTKIGLILRDKHGVPKAKLIGKKITKILSENKLPHVTERSMFEKKIENLNMHISKHKHDYSAKRSLAKGQWTIKKLK